MGQFPLRDTPGVRGRQGGVRRDVEPRSGPSSFAGSRHQTQRRPHTQGRTPPRIISASSIFMGWGAARAAWQFVLSESTSPNRTIRSRRLRALYGSPNCQRPSARRMPSESLRYFSQGRPIGKGEGGAGRRGSPRISEDSHGDALRGINVPGTTAERRPPGPEERLATIFRQRRVP